jgi:L-lactate utilization protein LutB
LTDRSRESMKKYAEKICARVSEAMQRRGLAAHYAETKEGALKTMLSLVPPKASVGLGGSLTVREIGGVDALRSGDYELLDQYREGLSAQEALELRRRGLTCDCFVTGTNAITHSGVLVNIDGSGNMVAGLAYGPSKVVIVAGFNKIVASLEDAIARVRNWAAPMNCLRLESKTPCYETGLCDIEACSEPERQCNKILMLEGEREQGRINVILVGERLGL